MVRDGLTEGDFEKINDLDFNEWLKKSGSIFGGGTVLTRSFYDAAFAYEGGKLTPDGMNIAAGTALYGALRLMLTYRGSLMDVQLPVDDLINGPHSPGSNELQRVVAVRTNKLSST